MLLTFLGKDSTPGESPTLYATDSNTYVVQGWIVTDPEVLSALDVPDDETVVEVTAKLMTYLMKDGLGSVSNLVAPIVLVLPNGNYIVQGVRVIDSETLGQMHIPDHETCVEVPKHAMLLLTGG